MGSDLHGIYKRLAARYGDLNWWPAKDAFEVMVGAVLTQNTVWSNVEKAIARFDGNLSPYFIEAADHDALARIIRPAGFFNQKTRYLKALTAWFGKYGYCADTVKKRKLSELRPELLSVKGIGPETADSILLYAFGYKTFVVDAYTRRLCERYPIMAGDDYAGIKNYFESRLPSSAALYNNCHALIVQNAKECCRKKPVCAPCPLVLGCAKLGL